VEDLSYVAFWVAAVSAGVATACFWASLVGVRVVMRRMATDAGGGPVVASVESANGGWSERLAGWGSAAAVVTAVSLLVWAVARWQAVDHAPWSNMYEFSAAFATAVTVFYVIFDRVYSREERAHPARVLGALVMPLVLAMLLLTAVFFPSEIRPLVPALQNTDLLAIHVAAMIVAYGALSVSFAAAVLYLAQGGTRNRFQRLPDARTLDDLAYRSVMVGFPVLALGIALGAYWADHAWGRYWGWDPKETSALVTWLIYGVYLHMRDIRGWSGTRSACVLVAGFGAVMFTYFAVNLWVSGLHSYAGV
jgi:cytochrome c-type biogenesis protein CcsB